MSKPTCRLCLNLDVWCKPVDIYFQGEDLAKLIYECAGIQVTKHDSQKTICHHCLGRLTLVRDFREQCQKNNELLKRYERRDDIPDVATDDGPSVNENSSGLSSKELNNSGQELVSRKALTSRQCKVCSKHIRGPADFYSHMKTHNVQDLSNELPSRLKKLCKQTAKEPTISRPVLRKRKRTAIKEKSRVGLRKPKEPKQPLPKESNYLHTLYYTNTRQYPCTQCKHTFNTTSTLAYHRSQHRTEVALVCKFCEKAFFSQKHLELHVNVVHHADKNDDLDKDINGMDLCTDEIRNNGNQPSSQQRLTLDSDFVREENHKNLPERLLNKFTGDSGAQLNDSTVQYNSGQNSSTAARNVESEKEKGTMSINSTKTTENLPHLFGPFVNNTLSLSSSNQWNSLTFPCRSCNEAFGTAKCREEHVALAHPSKVTYSPYVTNRLKAENELNHSAMTIKMEPPDLPNDSLVIETMEHIKVENFVFTEPELETDTKFENMALPETQVETRTNIENMDVPEPRVETPTNIGNVSVPEPQIETNPQVAKKTEKLNLLYYTVTLEHACSTCTHTFSKLNDMKEHERKHETKVAFTCGKCKKVFFKQKSLDLHEKVVHFEGLTPPVPAPRPYNTLYLYKCDNCSFSFSTFNALQEHRQRNHGSQLPLANAEHSLTQEGKTEAQQSQIVATKTVAETPKPAKERSKMNLLYYTVTLEHQCKLCPHSFSMLKDLRDHKRKHKTKTSFTCKHCKKVFFKEKSLQLHESVVHSSRQISFSNDSKAQQTVGTSKPNVKKTEEKVEDKNAKPVCNPTAGSQPADVDKTAEEKLLTNENPCDASAHLSSLPVATTVRCGQDMEPNLNKALSSSSPKAIETFLPSTLFESVLSNTLFECNFCKKVFRTSQFLADHKLTVHTLEMSDDDSS